MKINMNTITIQSSEKSVSRKDEEEIGRELEM